MLGRDESAMDVNLSLVVVTYAFDHFRSQYFPGSYVAIVIFHENPTYARQATDAEVLVIIFNTEFKSI